MSHITFSNHYLELGKAFYQLCEPTPVKRPYLIKFNQTLATELGITNNNGDEDYLLNLFSGNSFYDASTPIAMAYSGHQFGQFNPFLGDGRALYLGELQHNNNRYFGIQLKGSGKTPYSRRGDGRSALGPVLREYLVSEAMYQYGIPTTRALAAVLTGETVTRDILIPGGILTRVASSYIRVGTFQYFAMQHDHNSIKALSDYVIKWNYPDLQQASQPYLALLETVTLQQATLIAQWMQLGFIHGVMNTDNMSIVGETIDYGPCAFLDTFEHNKVFSSIDHSGRYAYNNQPAIGLWNLSRFAECLLPLLSDNEDQAIELAQSILDKYIAHYDQQWLYGFMNKCGLLFIDEANRNNDKQFIESLLNAMEQGKADFTLCFYQLSRLSKEPSRDDDHFLNLFNSKKIISQWLEQWRSRLALESISHKERQASMQKINPVYIPRNHHIEAAIRAAEDNNDLGLFHALHDVLQDPFTFQEDKAEYLQAPKQHQVVYKTFCGT